MNIFGTGQPNSMRFKFLEEDQKDVYYEHSDEKIDPKL